MVGAAGARPAGEVGTQGAGAPGDQHGAAGLPAPLDGVVTCPGQPACENAGGPDGDLVFAVAPGGEGESAWQEGVGAGGLRQGGKVDKTTPQGGVLQGRHPAQAPELGRAGGGDGVGGRGGDRAAGDAPQGGAGAGVDEGLDGDGQLLECLGQAQYPVNRAGPGDLGGQFVAVQGQGGGDHFQASRAGGGSAVSGQQQPASGRWRRCVLGETVPGDLIHPGARGGLYGTGFAPPGRVGSAAVRAARSSGDSSREVRSPPSTACQNAASASDVAGAGVAASSQ